MFTISFSPLYNLFAAVALFWHKNDPLDLFKKLNHVVMYEDVLNVKKERAPAFYHMRIILTSNMTEYFLIGLQASAKMRLDSSFCMNRLGLG